MLSDLKTITGELKQSLVMIPVAKRVQVAVLSSLMVWFYFRTYSWLIVKDWAKEDYSAAFLVPIIFFYILYEKRAGIRSIPSIVDWKGLFFFVPGIMIFWVGELSGEYFSLYISSWLVFTGVCWLLTGWNRIKANAFAFLFLLTMFPLPNFLYGKVSFQLRMISTKIGVWLIQLTGLSAMREGNVIDLGFTRLQVVDACSGLRYLIPMIMLGLLIAYFYRTSMWKRIFLVVSTIPLSIFVNSIRIASVGILYKFFGPVVAEGFFHDFQGWFIFMATLLLLLWEMWLLNKIGKNGTVNKSDDTNPDQEEPFIQKTHQNISLFQGQFVVAVILIGGTLALSQGINFREKTPVAQPLKEFPVSLDQWKGYHDTMEQEIIDTLDLSDYFIMDWKNGSSPRINSYVAYYESQRSGESIHTPATCLPGGGWIFKQSEKIQIPIEHQSSKRQPVQRVVMENNGMKQLVYYWFNLRDRTLTNVWEMKFYNFWDALTRQRTDGALVRLITPMADRESVDQAEKRLIAFSQAFIPELKKYLPQ